MLGKLVKGLRMLGYDTIYYRGEDPYQLMQMARQESRVILTRNIKLISKRSEDQIIQIREDNPFHQLEELIQKGLISLNGESLLSRCLLCNTLLNKMEPEEAVGKVPDFIFYQKKEFFMCPQCQRIYWEGSHQENMKKKIVELFEQS
jgi:hypothetical protein